MFSNIFSLTTLYWILLPIYVVSCFGLIVIVLLQKGKGTGFAGAFGIGAGSETVFGPRSSQSLPVKLTYVAAFLFMFIALVMSIINPDVGKGQAPDLVEEIASDLDSPESGLEERGLGTNVSGENLTTDAALDTESDAADTPPSDTGEITNSDDFDELTGAEETTDAEEPNEDPSS